jgi:glycosyltransferase involved in cell wall biosynthesis
MQKVLFIAHWFPTSDFPLKGIFVRNHAICLNAICDLTVVNFSIEYGKSLRKVDISRAVDKDGLDILEIRIRSRFYKLIYYALKSQQRLLKKALLVSDIDVQSFDLLVSNVLFPSGIGTMRLAETFRKPFIHIEHWSHLSGFLSSDTHRKEGQLVLDRAKSVIVVSDLLKQSMVQFCDPAKVHVIPNVVKSYFDYVPKLKQDEVLTFLAVASWKSPKNPFVFVRALEEIAKTEKRRIVLTLVGDGPQLIEVKKIVKKIDLRLPGQIANTALSRFYQEADFFLHGSDYETFSIVSIEALFTGTPVIGSRVGVLPEVIDDSNGVICNNTLESWIDGIEAAISRNYDHEAISTKSKQKFSEQYIMDLFAGQISND